MQLLLVLLVTTVAVVQGVTYTGYLADLYCINAPNGIAIDGANMKTSPQDHTVGCMTDITECKESGFALLENDGSTDSPNYVIKYTLDAASNAEALELLEGTGSLQGFAVKVSGSLDGEVITTTSMKEFVTYTGYLADNYCLEMPGGIAIDGANLITSPGDHLVHCLRDVRECIESGYSLLENRGSAASPRYEIKYKLDQASNDKALDMIKDSELVDNYLVTVTGTISTASTPIISVESIAEGDVDGNFPDSPEGSEPVEGGSDDGGSVAAPVITGVFGGLIVVVGVLKAVYDCKKN